MTSYNPEVNYHPKTFDTKMINLSLLEIYLNNSQYVKIQLPDVFKPYSVIPHHDVWKIPLIHKWIAHHGVERLEEYFMYYRCQLNFAVYCATTALGVSEEHLTNGNNLLRSVYRFHVYYHVRKILICLEVALPHQKGFDKFDSVYNSEAYHTLCESYGVDPDTLWIRGDWYYSPRGAIFFQGTKSLNSGYAPSDNYCQWILRKSSGFTKLGIEKLNDSVMAYTYLVLNSQANARSTLLGNSGNAIEAQMIFKNSFKSLITSSMNASQSISHFQDVLKYARSKVDFNIGIGIYMLPSDMNLRIRKITGWNNKILVSEQGFQIGVNTTVNDEKPTSSNRFEAHRLAAHHLAAQHEQHEPHEQHEHVNDEKPTSSDRLSSAKQHKEEKIALILVDSLAIGIFLWVRRK